MNNLALWALGIVLAITQLINLTYFEGLSSDFSDLALQVVAANASYNAPFTVVDRADGAWIVVNATLPEDGSYTLNVLSSSDGSGSYEETVDPSIIEVPYQEGFAQDFSNLVVAFISPDGAATPATHSLIGMSEGQWAIIALPRPPMAGETISFMAKVGDVQPSSGAGVPSGDTIVEDGFGQNETGPPDEPELEIVQNEAEPPDEPALETTDSSNDTADSASEPVLRFFDAKGNEHKAEGKKGKNDRMNFKLEGLPVREITFDGLNTPNSSLGVDFPKDVPSPDGLTWSQVYAIDPTALDFTSASVTVTAQGNALYKCKDWDFASRSCGGEWVLMRDDLVPGENYDITITPEDPAFGEANITVIDVQSYPVVGGDWTVRFTTTGTANLSIRAVNGTSWDDSDPSADLNFLELRCGDITLSPVWDDDSKTVLYEDYFCSDTGYETSRVLTSGAHHLEFRFGDDTDYANNDADPCVNLSDNTTYGDNVVNFSSVFYVNNDTTLCTGTYTTTGHMFVMNASNITLDCNGTNISGDRGAGDYGINITNFDFVTVKNCIVDNFGTSFYLSGTTDNASIDNNTMTNMYNYGVYLYNLYSNGNNITNNRIIKPATLGNYGVYLYYADNNFLSGNNISADDDGVYFYYASYNTLVNNSFTSGTDNGVYLYVGNYNNLTNNSATSSFDYGYYVASNWNNFIGNNASNNSQSGFYVNSAYNNFVNNNASRNTYHGYYVSGGDSNNFTNNIAYGNVRHGIYLSTNANANIMRNNLVYGNSYGSTTYYGYDIESCTGNRIENDMVYGNGLYGIYFYAPTGNNITDTRVYNHTYDTYIQYTASGQGIYFRNLTIDNPAGTMENFTSLDIFDNTTAAATYYIDWASSPATLPSERISFRGKFVNITNTTGAVEINSINWTWDDSEATSEYVEDYFELWKYNDSWSVLNYTLITAQNKISMAGMSPASVFGILDWNVTLVPGCMEISANGTAHLTNNLEGANISDSNYPGLSCVKIATSNLVLDCLGYNITNNGTGGATAGILANSTSGQTYTNITIQNCPGVSGYGAGVYLPYVQASVQNSTFKSNDYNVNASSQNVSLADVGLFNATVNDLRYSNEAGSDTSLDLANVLFLRPAGDLTNFTNLSLYDSAASGSAYYLNWSSEPIPDGLPLSHVSVLGRFVDIAPITGAVSLDSVTWHWTQAEISGYDELLFELWKHNSSNWTLLNNTPNTGSDYISVHDHDPASTYALLENQGVSAISGCTEITGGGIYQLQGGVSGANISDGTYAGLACIKIAADNVLFDCAGYPIVNNGTGGTTYGILANGSASAPLGGITIRNCPVSDYTYGEYISYTEAEGRNTTLSGNGYNAYIGDSNATLLGYTYYGAGNGDLMVYHSPSVSLEDNLFLNPSGTLQNYTNLSLSDAADAEEYLFAWADEPAALPAFFSSFGGKYLNITNTSGAAVLDSASWGWLDSEVGSANESRLALYKYNESGWTPLNGTPDTGNNTISVSSHNVGSTYALFENSTLMNCPVINASGTYVMGADFYGAPNPIFTTYYACVLILASNVDLDCNGYLINHTQTSSTMGIAVNGTRSNITIRNCNVNGFQQSAYIPDAQFSTVAGNNFTNFSSGGNAVYITSSYNNITGNRISATLSGADGIYLNGASAGYNHITNNTIMVPDMNIYDSNGDYNVFSGNTLHGTTAADGIYFTSASMYNNITDNRIYNMTNGIYYSNYPGYSRIIGNNISNISNVGIYISYNSDNNLIADNTVFNATNYGIYIYVSSASTTYYCDYNNMTNNTLSRCGYGIYLRYPRFTRLANNTIANATSHGLYVNDVIDLNLSGDRYINNSRDFYVVAGSAAARAMRMSNEIFDSRFGNFTNFTNVSITDTVATSSSYYIDWSSNSSALPAGRTPFLGRFVNISRSTGNVTIENLTFHWTDSESASFDEEYFELWKFNASDWTLMNGTADQSANTLSLYDHNVSSIYAILEGISGTTDMTECGEIASNGSYRLTASITGAPFDANPYADKACIKITASDVTLDCDGFNITNNESGTTHGIQLSGSLANVTVKDCTGIGGYSSGIYAAGANFSVFTNNSVFGTVSSGSIYGIHIAGTSIGNNITGNHLRNLSQQGFKLASGASGNLLSGNGVNDSSVGFSVNGNNNTLDGNSVYRCASGIEVEGAANTTVRNNDVANATNQGYWTLGGASETRFINNTARNTSVGFDISGSGNAVANNTAYANTGASGGDGFRAFGSDSTYTNNSAYGNSHSGFYLAYASGINMSANRALNNSGTGLIAEGANNTRLSGERFFGNGLDMLVNATSEMELYAEYAVFDSPAGSLEAFTNLSINDTIPASSAYSISWTSNSSALPPGAASFRGKFVNITPRDGAVSIDSIAWHWTAAEESGYIENFFELYKYNSSGWSLVSSSPDTSNNEFLVTGLEPNSDYGILQSADVGDCMLIDAQGLFQLSGNLVGANISTPELTYYGGNLNTSFACIKIASSNVTLDCNGYSIVNDGTLNASGIAVAGTNTTNYTNVEIRNCPDVSGYANGIMFSYTQQGRIANTSVSDWNSGIVLLYSSHNNITGNTARDGNDGIAANSYCSYNLFADNTVYNNVYGIGIWHYSTNNSLVNNTAYDNNWYGLFSYNRCNGTLFENNTVHSGGDGIYSWLNRDDRIINNTAYNNTRGIVIDRSNYCNVTLNTVYGNQYGLMEYFNANHTVFSDMEVFNNTRYGLYVHQATNLTIRNIHAYGNGNDSAFLDNDDLEPALTTISVFNLTIDSPGGIYQNFTRFNITDTIENDTGYVITWAAEPASLPSNTTSFAGKFANISRYVTGSSDQISIDTIIWNWDESELNSSHNESGFELWKFNSTSWRIVSSSPDAATNTFTINNLDPESTYGILNSSRTECSIIDAPGVYQMVNDYYGAPFDTIAGDPLAFHFCMKIASSDVVFDCNGYGIANDGTPDAAAIMVNGSGSVRFSNITIRNCPLLDSYSYGVLMNFAENSTVSNVTVNNSEIYGIHLLNSNRNNVSNNTAYNNQYHGILGENSNHTLYAWNVVFDTYASGIVIYYSENVTIADNTAYNGGDFGIYMFGDTDNLLANNTVYGNDLDGFLFSSSTYDTLVNNTARNNSQAGIYLANSFDITINDSNAYWNGIGLFLEDSGGLVAHGGHIYGNGQGVRMSDSGSVTQPMNLSGMVFDNPSGSYQNYTNISLYDSVLGGEVYTINWTSNPGSLPVRRFSFADKFLNITGIAGDLSINSLSLHWLDSELGLPYDEASFELWKRNSTGWAMLNATLYEGANTITALNVSSFSDFGILQSNDTTPPSIALNFPAPGANFATSSVYFGWNATDDLASSMLCNLTINGTVNESNITSPNNTITNVSVSGLSVGYYLWNVTCADDEGNANTSETRNFTILSSANLTPVDLGSAANFVILAGTAITGSINTNLVGDVGLSPTGGAAITLLQCDDVSGAIYDTDGGYAGGGGNDTSCQLTDASLLTTAKNDLTTAYNDAAGRAPTTIYGPIYDLGGQTLTPGIYNDPTSFGITGNLTLDAQGNATAVFIFQAGSTLITEPGSNVILINGAQASNVFWQVGSSATLGTNSVFYGNILALTAITLNPGTEMTGRLLAQNSFVTLNDNNVTLPSDGPEITFVPPTDNSSAVVSRPYILANVTATGNVSLDNITIYLYNATGSLLNSSNGTASPLFANFTGLPDGLYYFNATACDAAAVCTSTETRNVTITSNCPIITSPGNYSQNQNYTGAPNDASEVSLGNVACLKIAASNVTWDCQGYSIANNGTSDAFGILLNGSQTNVTVMNCPSVSGYNVGAYIYSAENSTFRNITANGSYVCFEVFDPWGTGLGRNLLDSDTAYNCSNSAFYIQSSNYNNITNSLAYDFGSQGFLVAGSVGYGNAEGNLLENNTARDSPASGFVLSQYGLRTTLLNNTAYNLTLSSGFAASNSDQNTLVNNTAYGNYRGFYLITSDSSLTGNDAHDNSDAAYYLSSAYRNNLTGNTAYGNANSAWSGTFYLVFSYNNSLANNSAWNNTFAGFYLNSAEENALVNNTAWTSQFGFYLVAANRNNLSGNLAYNHSAADIYSYGSSLCNYINNTARDSPAGIQLIIGSENNTLEGNEAYNESYGFWISESNNNTLQSNLAHECLVGIVVTQYSNLTGLISNEAYNCSNNGIQISYANNTYSYNNSAYQNGQYGIMLYSANYTSSYFDKAYGNAAYQLLLMSVSDSNLFSNTLLYGGQRGAEVDGSSNNSFIAITAANSSAYGFYIYDSNATYLDGPHFYNSSGWDFGVYSTGTARSFDMVKAWFDSPPGNFANFTQMYVKDSVEADTSYAMKWTRNSSALPASQFSFAEKWVDVSPVSGPVSIDEINWTWTDGEVTAGGYNESKFGLWKYNSTGWTLENATPDTAANTLGMYAMDPASEYGILQDNLTITGCMEINSSGSYTMNESAFGAPFDAAPLVDFACIKIEASDVIFDCAGYNITYDGTASGVTYGILLNGSISNVTVQNCPNVTNYTYGVYVFDSDTNSISNVTAISNSDAGFKLDGSGSNNVSGCIADWSGNSGFVLENGSDGNLLSGNNASNSVSNGFAVSDSDGNSLIGNIAHYNSFGYYLSAMSGFLFNNTAHDNENTGFLGATLSNLSFLNNTARDNGLSGMELSGINDSQISGTTAHGNGGDGVLVYVATATNLTGNTAYMNGNNGLTFASSPDGYLENNTAFGNAQCGLGIASANATIIQTHLFNDTMMEACINAGKFITMTVYFVNLTIDSPSGVFENYTALNMTDTLDPQTGININWTSNSSALPSDRFSFAQKFVNISAFGSPAPGIDSIEFTWQEAEAVTPYNEALFELWEYNSSGWTVLNYTPDTSLNTLSLANMAPHSDYAILQNNYTGCVNLSDPLTWGTRIMNISGTLYVNENTTLCRDTYYLDANGTSLVPLLYMNVSNIFLDCNDSILDGMDYDGKALQIGYFGMGFDPPAANVSILNCYIRNYGYAFVLESTSNDSITNCTAFNNTFNGFGVFLGGNNSMDDTLSLKNQYGYWMMSTSNNSISNSESSNNTLQGIYEETSTYGRYANISLRDNSEHGLHSYSSYYSDIGNCTAESNHGSGILLSKGKNPYHSEHNVHDCLVHHNYVYGIQIDGAFSNILSNNTAHHHEIYGIYLLNTVNNTLEGNDAYQNGEGYYLYGSGQNRMADDSASGNTGSGYTLLISPENNLTSCNATGNGAHGIGLLESEGTIIDPSYFCNNVGNGISVNNSNNTVVDDSVACNNTQNGIYILDSNNTLVNRSNVYNNSYGIYLANADYSNFSTSNITNNTNDGIRFDNASTGATLLSNYVCFNALDVNNQGSSNIGSLDRCDSFINWAENGHLGCEYSCSSMWHRFFGNANGTIVLTDSVGANLVYSWNATAMNVYFTDFDSAIDWQALQAIGRTTANASAASDFIELDIAFNTTSYPDNINATYSSDGSAPLETRNYTVYNRPIDLVPVANSTAFNTSFDTGILWDISDGGTEYTNTINQSTVWMVAVNASTADTYGTYDFLIQVPETLATYEGGNDVVSVYVELE